MTTTETGAKGVRKKRKQHRAKAKEQAVLSVVSLRISDEEKERIDEIMRIGNIKRYSDVMKMAIQLLQVPNDDNPTWTGTYR